MWIFSNYWRCCFYFGPNKHSWAKPNGLPSLITPLTNHRRPDAQSSSHVQRRRRRLPPGPARARRRRPRPRRHGVLPGPRRGPRRRLGRCRLGRWRWRPARRLARWPPILCRLGRVLGLLRAPHRAQRRDLTPGRAPPTLPRSGLHQGGAGLVQCAPTDGSLNLLPSHSFDPAMLTFFQQRSRNICENIIAVC